MFSLRSASLAGVFAFGLMGCATQGLGQVQTAYDPSASYDPSSVYQPSPNARPLAVAPPSTVTGAVGEGGATKTAHCSVAAEEGLQGVSPNARLCP